MQFCKGINLTTLIMQNEKVLLGTTTIKYNRNQEVLYSYFNPSIIESKKQSCKLKSNDIEILKEEAKKVVASWFLKIEQISEQDLFEYKLEMEEVSKAYFVGDPLVIKSIVFNVYQVKI